MNIFIINHYAGSPEMGMEYRPYYFAKLWTEMGHHVTILAADYSHLRKKNPEIDTDIKEEIIDGITYVWIKTSEYEGNGLGRVKNMYSFIRQTLYKASFFNKIYQPDIVIASSTYPSDNYVARKMCKLSKAKHIYEVHDLWPLSPMELGDMSKYHPFIVAMQHAENFAYRKADAVVSLLPNTQEHMKSHGLDLKKWHYVPNGIAVNEWNNKVELNDNYLEIIRNLKKNNKFIIGYAGGHALSNSLITIVEAAKKISKLNTDIQFVLVGNGNEKKNLIQASKGLKNILFLDSIPKQEIPNLLYLMDVLIITWNKNSLYRFGINPNKIFDYMMASKPIIHAVDAPNNFVDKAKCGIALNAEDSEEIVNSIIKLKQMPKEKLQKMGRNGHEFVKNNYDYKILVNKYLDIISNI